MTAQPSADLEVYQPPALAVVPPAEGNDFDSWIAVAGQVVKLAREICDTPFVPDGLRGSAPAVAAAILAGRELGLPPITALQHTHVIKGKIGHTALLMRALIMSEGHDWQDVDVSDTRAVVKGRRKGESEWAEASFTAAQAKIARIDLGGYPQDKLYARATVRLARRKFADVILGMPHAAEELEDGETPDATPAAAANGQQDEPKASPRTARRKTAAAGDDTRGQRAGGTVPRRPDENGAGPDSAAAGAAQSQVPQPLPPLPGEPEPPDPTPAPGATQTTPQEPTEPAADLAPGEAAEYGTERHRKLVGIVRAHFKRLGYTDDDDTQRLEHTAKLAGVAEIGSTNDLDLGELSQVADTLARVKNIEALQALLNAGAVDG